MAYNLITSNTATPYIISGTFGTAGLGTQGLNYSALGQSTLGGITMYVQQNSTSALTITAIGSECEIGSTASFFFLRHISVYRVLVNGSTISIVIPAGTANYRIPLPVLPSEHTFLVIGSVCFCG